MDYRGEHDCELMRIGLGIKQKKLGEGVGDWLTVTLRWSIVLPPESVAGLVGAGLAEGARRRLDVSCKEGILGPFHIALVGPSPVFLGGRVPLLRPTVSVLRYDEDETRIRSASLDVTTRHQLARSDDGELEQEADAKLLHRLPRLVRLPLEMSLGDPDPDPHRPELPFARRVDAAEDVEITLRAGGKTVKTTGKKLAAALRSKAFAKGRKGRGKQA
jgi:hypothetical protein